MIDVPVNIKIFIEGEEEIGSPFMAEFIEENKKDLEADVIVIADSGNIKSGVPTITTSLRGLVDGIIVVDQKMNPVHSGLGGGVVPDAFMVLSKIISSFHNEKGELLIDGLTPTDQDVYELSEEFVQNSLSSNGVNLFEMDSFLQYTLGHLHSLRKKLNYQSEEFVQNSLSYSKRLWLGTSIEYFSYRCPTR